jgi:polyribonucleotide nucleotidyltransferase
MEESALELLVAGTQEGVLMVESEAKELSEEVMLGAVIFGHQQMQPVINLIIELAEACAKEPRDLPPAAYDRKAAIAKLEAIIGAELKDAYAETAKQIRYTKLIR